MSNAIQKQREYYRQVRSEVSEMPIPGRLTAAQFDKAAKRWAGLLERSFRDTYAPGVWVRAADCVRNEIRAMSPTREDRAAEAEIAYLEAQER